MKKLLFVLLIIPCITLASDRVVVIHKHEYIATETITKYDTKTIKVKVLDFSELESGTNVKSNDTYTYTITVKKVKKIK